MSPKERQPVSPETKADLREILAEPYNPNWRSKLALEILERQDELRAIAEAKGEA